jgi:hypothetical protein
MSKRALGIFAAIMLFTGLVVLQVASSMKPRAAQVATLPDGSTLRLEAVSYGKEHFRPGAWWHPLARRLPADWQRKLKVDAGPAMSTSEPSLGVWLSWDKSGASTHGWWDFGLVDEQGVEAPASSRSNQESTRAGQPTLLGYAFTAFPRRGSSMILRVYQRDSRGGRQLAASFNLSNPARGKYPEWRPASAPTSVKCGDLEITFKRLLVGVGDGHESRAPKQGEETWARAEFDVKDKGAPTDVWVPDGIVMQDATGNLAWRRGWASGLQNGSPYLRWRPYLWPSEAAWKIHVEFKRSAKAVFSTNELVVVTGIALPALDNVTELNLTTNRLGHTVRVLGLTDGKGKIGDRTSRMSGIGVRLEVDVSPDLGTGKRLTIVKVRDDQGREVESRGFGQGNSSYSFGYDPQADTKSLDFTLAVQEVVTAEFLVKPELFQPVPPPKK